MNIIKKIGLKGVGPYRKGTVFDVPTGITYLYGRNELNGGNANAAGKSSFASCLAELFYDQPIIGTRKDKTKAGSRFVEYVRGSNTIRIGSSFKGKTEKLEVKVNGESKAGRTSTLTREVMKKLWPITETEYLSYGFIDSNLPHPLVRGSTTERKAFFTSFFGLDKLDAERKIFAAELLKVKKVKAAYTELEKTFQTVKMDMLSKEKRERLEAEIEKLEKTVTQLRSESTKVQAIKSLLDFESYAANQIKELQSICSELNDFESVYKQTRRDLSEAESQAEQLEEYRTYIRDLKSYKQKTEGLDLSKDRDEVEANSNLYLKTQAQLKGLKPVPEPQRIKKVEEPASDKSRLLVTQAELVHNLEHSKKFGTGVCFACGQSVKTEPKEVILSKLKKVRSQLEEWDRYEEYKQERIQYVKDKKEFDSTSELTTELKFKLSGLIVDHDLWSKLSRIHKPERVEKPSGVKEIEPLKARFEVLKFCRPHVKNIQKLKNLRSEDRALTFDSTQLNKLQDRLSELKSKLEVHRTVKNRAADIRTRLAELKADAEKEQALALLVSAYGDKAIKKMVVESISQHLMKIVNKYASLVFDSYKFEFIWDTEIRILVHRPLPEGTTDVRKLSGAQSKLFTLILVISMLAFVPKQKRLSLLVLDEPTASFSEQTTELFHKLLPHLNNLIPSVIVITPESNERLEGANEYTVLKTKEGAKIVSGHPSQI